MCRTFAATVVAGGLLILGREQALGLEPHPGMRFVSVATADAMPAGVNIEPGDRVDLSASYDDPRTGQRLTKVIVQNVMVMFLDKQKADASGKAGSAGWIALEVKAEQAELVVAADRGK